MEEIIINIAVVEDEQQQILNYQNYLDRFQKERKITVKTHYFNDGLLFLEQYHQNEFDIVLMDIAMPQMNGLETAKRLRTVDKNVCLIFITTLAQYAIKGYEVDALDFLIKPVRFDLFSIKLEKAIKRVNKNKESFFVIKTSEEVLKISTSKIIYIESEKHYLNFHTYKGIYKMRGTIDEVKDFFYKNSFASINRSLIINLLYVEGYTKTDVILKNETLPLSRVYKDEFCRRIAVYLGE